MADTPSSHPTEDIREPIITMAELLEAMAAAVLVVVMAVAAADTTKLRRRVVWVWALWVLLEELHLVSEPAWLVACWLMSIWSMRSAKRMKMALVSFQDARSYGYVVPCQKHSC